MCAILDASVISEVFGSTQHPAGKKFYEWMNSENGMLVVGGKLSEDLYKSSIPFRKWAATARQRGRMRTENTALVETRTRHIKNSGVCKSNDSHILALAQVSGARLLYSNDKDLRKDFKNKKLIDKPLGKIYSTLKCKNFTRAHRDMLNDKKLCRAK